MLILLEYLPEFSNTCRLYVYKFWKRFLGHRLETGSFSHLFSKPSCSQPLRVALDVGTGTGAFYQWDTLEIQCYHFGHFGTWNKVVLFMVRACVLGKAWRRPKIMYKLQSLCTYYASDTELGTLCILVPSLRTALQGAGC